jgi:hypothetical protein
MSSPRRTSCPSLLAHGRSSALLLTLVATACGPRDDYDDGASSGDSTTSAQTSATTTATADATADTLDGTSDTAEQACFDAWQDPMSAVVAIARPAAAPAMRLHFEYEPGVVTLTEITEEEIVLPPDGPFDPDENSGSWVELRGADEAVLYTRLMHTLVPESVEVVGPLGQLPTCPEDGFIQITNVPNDPAMTQVVFFQEPIDGESTLQTIELMRFELPPPR